MDEAMLFIELELDNVVMSDVVAGAAEITEPDNTLVLLLTGKLVCTVNAD